MRHLGKRVCDCGIRQSGTGSVIRPGDKVLCTGKVGGSRRFPGFRVSKSDCRGVTAGGSEISRRSMTGRICVRKREKWRVLCNVNAARGGRGLQTAASSPGSAQEQIASAATSPRLCSGLMNQVTWALLFWARPAPRPPPPPLPQELAPCPPARPMFPAERGRALQRRIY